jgi:hypothetical protein
MKRRKALAQANTSLRNALRGELIALFFKKNPPEKSRLICGIRAPIQLFLASNRSKGDGSGSPNLSIVSRYSAIDAFCASHTKSL